MNSSKICEKMSQLHEMMNFNAYPGIKQFKFPKFNENDREFKPNEVAHNRSKDQLTHDGYGPSHEEWLITIKWRKIHFTVMSHFQIDANIRKMCILNLRHGFSHTTMFNLHCQQRIM